MLKVCDKKHWEIVYDGTSCPYCGDIAMKDQIIVDLENEVKDLRDELKASEIRSSLLKD